jgi:hypothetical protein
MQTFFCREAQDEPLHRRRRLQPCLAALFIIDLCPIPL